MARSRVEIVVKQTGAAKAQKEMQTLGQSVSATIGKFAGWIAVGATMQRVGAYMVDIAKKADGIRAGFENLNKSNLLAEMRKAVKGTVTDLELMQRAVMANNVGISLDKLGALFEFARRTAKETGQSVDYLVDSIVLGLGRKSALILDNLGLSVTQINEEFLKTGDFVTAAENVINRKMESMSADITTFGEVVDREMTKAKNRLALVAEAAAEEALALAYLAGKMGIIEEVTLSTNAATTKEIEQKDRLLDMLTAEMVERKKFTDEQRKQISQREWEAMLIEDLNHQLIVEAGLWRDVLIPEMEKIDRIPPKIDKVNKRIKQMQVVQSEMGKYAADVVDETIAEYQSFAGQLAGVLSSAAQSNQNFFSATLQGFSNMLQQMVAEMAARAAIFAIFSLFTGGGALLGGASKFIFGGMRAGGGPVAKDKSYIVGENGPELFTPKTSGHINPQPIQSQMINININGNVISDRRWVRDKLIPEIMNAQARGLA